MNTEFQRTQIEIGGRSVAVTSWYESEKQRFRANAPAFLHLYNESDASDAQNAGATREVAIRAVRDRLSRCLPEVEVRRKW